MLGRRGLLFSLVGLTLVAAGLILWRDTSAGYDGAGQTSQEQAAVSDYASQFWTREIVDMPGFFDGMSDRSLRFDSTGQAHMVYGGDRLYYAVFDGAEWRSEIVDEDIGTGTGASLALDANDRPHISYLDLLNVALKYAHRPGDQWALQVVDKAYPYQERTSIAIDGDGRPHIAYRKFEWLPPDHNCPGLGYAQWTGSQWQLERFNDCGHFVSMALDSNGVPHITFNDKNRIQHATKVGGAWQVNPVNDQSAGYGSSVAVDSHDRPHVAYIEYTDVDQLTYAFWNGSQWASQAVQEASSGLYLSLLLDGQDKAHIAYGNQYITLDGNGLDRPQGVSYVPGSFSSIALDGAGRPAISYKGYSAVVYCDRWDGDEWLQDVVDWGGSAGWSNSLDLDSAGEPHLSYYSSSYSYGGAIQYAWRSGDAWSTETITLTYLSPYADVNYDTSLVVDNNDTPHVTYWYSEYYTDGLYYGTRSGDSWQIEQIADEADSPNELVLDGAGRPHVAFIADDMLKYGYRDSGGWIVSDVETDVVRHVVSLALDGAGRPRILFLDWVNDNKLLKMAAWTGVTWTFEEIATFSFDHWVEASLTLDAAGDAHVVYVVSAENDDYYELFYAVKDGADWTSTSVDYRKWSMGSPAIMIGQDGLPFIVFVYRGVQVATLDGGAWNVNEAFPMYGGELSAVVGDSGLFTSYYDSRGHGLVLAGPLLLEEALFIPLTIK